jgi:phosphatidylserine/phosphatidylglycerophosphate/cardiolipin synthase-like enzyme
MQDLTRRSHRLAVRPRLLPGGRAAIRALADQALSRAAGAPLVAGNDVRVLRDAAENYPAWDAAIDGADSSIQVEMYIIRRDRVGRAFVDRLAAKARQGVAVRVLYDWFGSGTSPALGLFRPLLRAGGEVRVFNPPTFAPAFGWLRRDHRKLITVDDRVAFVSGLCVSEKWLAQPGRRRLPWRDTGVALRGPVVAHAVEAFADMWRLSGGVLPDAPLPAADSLPEAGPVHVRLVPTEPFTASMLRLDLLVAAMARETLWITDAYFLDHGPYLESLRRAAADGVDVRLLLPRDSDLGWSVPAARTLYRTLLEGGVRVYEWNGSMIHAKTAVVDGRWSRVGSTNLNLNSWLGNWELDVAIEDTRVSSTLAAHFEEDLGQATEIVLHHGRRSRNRAPASARTRARGSARRVVRAVSGVGRSVGAAVTGSRPLGDYELVPLLSGGLLLVGLAAAAYAYPSVVVWPAVALAVWTGLSLLGEAMRLWRARGEP